MHCRSFDSVARECFSNLVEGPLGLPKRFELWACDLLPLQLSFVRLIRASSLFYSLLTLLLIYLFFSPFACNIKVPYLCPSLETGRGTISLSLHLRWCPGIYYCIYNIICIIISDTIIVGWRVLSLIYCVYSNPMHCLLLLLSISLFVHKVQQIK